MEDKLKHHEEFLREFLTRYDSKGYLKHRESSTVEFKENFNFGSMPEYAKIMAAFANNKGGYIIFGIKDKPRILIGVRKKKFDDLKTEKITGFLLEYFEPEIFWEIGTVEIEDKIFGFIYTYESNNKPVICKKNAGNGELKSGEIYYRYRAQTRRIEYPELRNIIDEYREKERRKWMEHIERIARIGPSNVALVDLLSGDIHVSKLEGAKLVMDKNLLRELKDRVNFIEEGRFSEKEGAPTLKIIGEIQTVDMVVPELDPNKDYPYLLKDLANELGIRRYDVQVLIWKFELKGNKKYHLEIQTGSRTKVHKYSKYALSFLRDKLDSVSEKKKFLEKISREYQKSRNRKSRESIKL